MFKKASVFMALAITLIFTAQSGFAELAVVGPTDAENGFPAYYQDSNGVALEIGLDPLYDFFDPVIAGNNFSQQIGFGAEAFWFLASAIVDMPSSPALPVGGQALIVMGVEAAFATGDPVNGQQFPFNRLRIRIDAPFAGTYKVTHPYGVDEFIVETPGIKAINSTIDIGGVMPDALTALSGRIGPFLTAVNPAPPLGHIGNGNILQTVAGSPFGNNYFRIQGPGGIDIQTDQFTLQGKIFSGVVGTPVTVTRATYEKEADHNAVDVMATSAPAAQVSVSGLTALPAAMVGDGTGKFYRHIHLNGAGPLPATLTVSALNAPNSETSIIKELVDIVQITRAEYDLSARTLAIEAVSGDQITPPVLTATGFGDLNNGSLLVADVLVPPASVTVTSSAGGSDTASVSITGHAVLPNTPPAAADDTTNTVVDTAVTINVLGNDVDLDGTINPATLTLINPSALNLAINADNTVTFTPALGFVGADTFSYTVQDDLGAISNTATVTVNVATVAPISPVAVDDITNTAANTAVTINVIANDTDADGINPASVVIVTQPASGSLLNNGDGTVTYTPNNGFSGADSFTYTVKDNGVPVATSNAATVSITVAPAENITVTTALFRIIGARWIISGTGSVPGSVITVRIEGGAQIGTANVSALGVWSIATRNSAIIPAPGATLRVNSSGGAELRNVAITIRN